MNSWDLWNEIIDIMGERQALDAVLGSLREEELMRLGWYINRAYDLGIGEEDED